LLDSKLDANDKMTNTTTKLAFLADSGEEVVKKKQLI
jgi:hypothetical protein